MAFVGSDRMDGIDLLAGMQKESCYQTITEACNWNSRREFIAGNIAVSIHCQM